VVAARVEERGGGRQGRGGDKELPVAAAAEPQGFGLGSCTPLKMAGPRGCSGLSCTVIVHSAH
jgi:hypothetical protein